MLVVAQLLVLLAAASAQQCRSSTPQNSYIDITVTTGVGLPVWASSVGLRRNWRARSMAIAEGDEVGITLRWCAQSLLLLYHVTQLIINAGQPIVAELRRPHRDTYRLTCSLCERA